MAEQPVQRRLAADVAGYSRLMGEDEEGTLAALTSHPNASEPDGLVDSKAPEQTPKLNEAQPSLRRCVRQVLTKGGIWVQFDVDSYSFL